MRKLLASSSITLTLQAFSFIPLKGPYYITDKNEVTKQLKNETLKASYYPTNYFLYDKSTSIMMTISMPKEQPTLISSSSHYFNENKSTIFKRNQRLKFLKGEFSFNNIHGRDSTSSIFSNNSEFVLHFKKGQFSKEKDKTILKNISTNINSTLVFRTYIKSSSNVKIKEKDELVILSKDNKKIELITALKKHFATIPSQIATDFVHALPNLNESSGKEALPKLYKYTFYSDLQDRLNESKILAVWGLIPTEILDNENNKKIIQSQIVGLAEDKNGKLFHWITDLKKDISELMQYAK